MKKRLFAAALILLLSFGIVHLPLGQNYKSPLLWAFLGEGEDKAVDVFIVGATADWGDDGTYTSSTWRPIDREMQTGLLSMQKSLYDGSARAYAPLYRQACLSIYYLPDPDRGEYLASAYADVESAFLYYLEHENQGQPFILAGFSQGADLALRLMEQHFDDEALQAKLVAAYLIGWRITEEDLTAYPHLKIAQGEQDTGVIISFNSEADSVTGSIIVPEGGYTYGINPMNWKTDETPAAREAHAGYCSISMTGQISNTTANVTGCRRDPERGTLILSDITPAEYPPKEDLFVEGCYHDYELNFFCLTIRENVEKRITEYLNEKSSAAM